MLFYSIVVVSYGSVCVRVCRLVMLVKMKVVLIVV